MAWAKVRAAADHFGVSERTVFSFLAEGMPSIKRGGLRLINLEKADRWLEERYAEEDKVAADIEKIVRSL